jgi:hypothetical protein
VWEFDDDGFPLISYSLPSPPNGGGHCTAGSTGGFDNPCPVPLALEILYHHLNDLKKAKDLYKEFEADVLARAEGYGDWHITDDRIESSIEAIYARRTALVGEIEQWDEKGGSLRSIRHAPHFLH